MAEVKNPKDAVVREPDAAGAPVERRDPAGKPAAPVAPKTSGAPVEGKEPLVNPAADRNTEGARQAGVTPRPTDKPIVGGDRG